MATERVGVMTGNLVEVELDGKFVGIIQNVNATEDLGLQPASGIGRPMPFEHPVGQTRYSLTIDVMNLLPAGLISNPDLKGLITNFEDAGIAPKSKDDLLKGLVFDIVVRLISTGKELYRFIACSYGGGSIQIQKHGITSRNAQFMAIDKLYSNGA